MSTQQTQPYTILELLSEDVNYQIPVYQRNYAWGRPQIRALIQDIYDYYLKSRSGIENYYIGSLVVAKKDNHFEVLDGQQRFTTLNLIALFLKSKLNNPKIHQFNYIRLSFESREKSAILLDSLWKFFSDQFLEKNIDRLNIEYGDHSILRGYRIIAEECLKIVQRNELEKFADYLLDHVIILRTMIPELADVTHYFDALNNRGEQLEAHEVIKAHFLSLLSTDDDRYLVHQVWSACQDMYKYVAYGFDVVQRKQIFGASYHDWATNNYNALKRCLTVENTSKDSDSEGKISYGAKLNLAEILKLDVVPVNQKHIDEESSERFTSIIDYPNFLMQVLKIYVKTYVKDRNPSSIALDDKTLLESFKKTIVDASHAKDFIYLLLKIRYLFDLYVIKRENSLQHKGCSLKKPKYYSSGNVNYVNTFSKTTQEEGHELALDGDQRNLVMLLSAFHVSYPTHARKNWLFSVLNWLVDHSQNISLEAYFTYVENLARTLIKKRYLSSVPQDYESFMYADKFDCDMVVTVQDIAVHFSYGKIPYFCFNYLDYVLLKKEKGSHTKFYFSYKDSIEHFYPQNPKVGKPLSEESVLHSFGNLGLVNQSENSTLTNDMPIQKASWLRKYTKVPTSLKLELMMQVVEKNGSDWNTESIEKHQREMVKLLIEDLNRKVCS
ncbi:DUF262 domain-containing protein [Acinetobacter guillouiae]|uniref:DUF262 domain-containing protein n=1 Tax=Acinetobacter guillouiae TaxID=106649 RepID=UPI003AF87534